MDDWCEIAIVAAYLLVFIGAFAYGIHTANKEDEGEENMIFCINCDKSDTCANKDVCCCGYVKYKEAESEEKGMTYKELFYKAIRLLNKNEITLGEYGEITKPLDREIEQEPRWIPVSERLPEANIYDRHGPVWKHEVLITGYLSYDDKKETFVNMAFAEDVRNKCIPNTNVTAWMPLPEPYKAESEG